MDVSSTQASSQAGPRELAEFIRIHRDEIVAEWEHVVREPLSARDLNRLALLDHIPELLGCIAEMADQLGEGQQAYLPVHLAEMHAVERLEEGFDLDQVIAEFSALRDCIVRMWAAEPPGATADALCVRALNQAIDQAIAASVQHFTLARDRTLHSLDRISAAALETRSLDEFLGRLLAVMSETTAAVDTAVILLRDGDVLRVRASVGMDGRMPLDFALHIGEGFAGKIAAMKRPRAVACAKNDPQMRCECFRLRGIHGLYGVPLIDRDEVIGVAHMGSLSASEFSLQDRRLFEAMAHRATAAISQHMLRDSAERRAREQQAVAGLGTRALAAVDISAVLDDAVHTITATLDVEMCVALALEPDNTFVVVAESGWGKSVLHAPRVPATDASLCGYAMHQREAVIVEDLAHDTHFEAPSFRRQGARSGIGVPIPLPGPDSRIYGILSAQSRRVGAFGAEHAAFMQACANVIGSAIELHMAIDQRALALEQEQAARIESERTLALLDSVLSTASVGIAFLDTDLRVVRVNETLARYSGVPVDAHIGRTLTEILGGELASAVERVLRDVIANRKPVTNVEVEGPRSTPIEGRWLLANYIPVQTAHGDVFGAGIVLVEITERKHAETELRERELELRGLADNLPQLAWRANHEGTITWVNQRWLDYTGVASADVMTHLPELVHPEHFDAVFARYLQHIQRAEPWEDTVPLRGKDGRYRWFLSRAVPIRDEHGAVVHWFGTNTDITESRFMAEVTTLLASSLDYRASLEMLAELAVPVMADWCLIHLVDEEHHQIVRVAITYADPSKAELVQRLSDHKEPSWDAPKGIAAVIRTGQPELMTSLPSGVLEQRIIDPELLQGVRQLGIVSSMSVPLVARNRILGAVTLLSAESGRHYTQHDLEVATELGRRAGLAIDNARLYEESQRETRIREDVLAVVSHDLKNPLGAIHLAATLLLEQPDPRYRKHLETIYRAATRMDHLIGDLLDMASIQAGRLALERKREEANVLVREVLDLHEPMVVEKGIELVRDCELPGVFVVVDHDRVLQVFGNLLGNAIKFCGTGDQITLHGEIEDHSALFSVTDTGPGIPARELPHIFQPYWSGKRHAKKGTGLGLFITKGIVEAHGGRIWVESTAGKGTTFYFTLPIE